MADLKISQLTGATTPLAGTEVLPIVQSSSTKKVAVSDLTAGRAVSMGTAEVTGASTKLSAEVFRTSATSYMRIAGGSVAAAGAYALMFGETHATAPGRLSLNAAGTGYAELGSGDGAYNLRLSSTGDATLSNGNFVQGTAAKGVNFTANTPAAGMTSQLLNWYEEGTWTPTVRGSGTAGTYELDANTTCRYTRVGRQVTLTVRIRMAAAVTGGGTGDLYITGVPFTKSANQIAVGSVYLALGTFSGNLPTVIFDSFEGTSTTLYFPQSASGGYGTSLPISFASANAYIGFTISYFV